MRAALVLSVACWLAMLLGVVRLYALLHAPEPTAWRDYVQARGCRGVDEYRTKVSEQAGRLRVRTMIRRGRCGGVEV